MQSTILGSMFTAPPAGTPIITYTTRLIHFAASVKEIDYYLRDWLDQFEGLLRRLYWESAFVRVETAFFGTHEFTWKPSPDWTSDLYKAHLRPITTWTFTSTLDAADLKELRNGRGLLQ